MNRLPSDIVGTLPKMPPLVDHSWLEVDVKAYDNYPSDNNPVRIAPKLNELWNPPQVQSSGLNLIPMTAPTQVHAATTSNVPEVVRETKKAMMAGLSAKEVADHLRARFTASDIAASRDELQKVASEQGLLGNVYIDASAFTSYNEAEQFLAKHRNRLARDIIVNAGQMTPELVMLLASKFHKNVVADVNYDQGTLDNYKMHLVGSGRIGKDFTVNSKETLRQAFLAKPVVAVNESVPLQSEPISDEQRQKSIQEGVKKAEAAKRIAEDEMTYSQVKGIVSYAREQMAKGKRGNDLKEVLRSKYLKDDLQAAAKYLIFMASDAALAKIQSLVDAGKLSENTAKDLIKTASKYPVKDFGEKPVTAEHSVGVRGFFYDMGVNRSASTPNKELCEEAVASLRKGADINTVRKALSLKLSKDQIDDVLLSAVNEFNITPAGVKANQAEPAPKYVAPVLAERQTLPDPETVVAQNQELVNFYAGAGEVNIQIDEPVKFSSLEVDDDCRTAGLDGFLKQ